MDQSQDSTWADRIQGLRGTFQATYDAMAHLLDETNRQWDADLQAIATALEQMRDLDRQRRQILDAVSQHMARLHALFLRTALAAPESGPAPHFGEAPPPAAQTAAAPDPAPAARPAARLDPADALLPIAPEPDSAPAVLVMTPTSAAAPAAPVAPVSPYANPGATYGPPMPRPDAEPPAEPVLPRLVQSF